MVEYMIVSFFWSWLHDTTFLQKIVINGGTLDFSASLIHDDSNVFAETGRVIIPHSFSIPECF
jgi:hypothetical protein